jgi:hypothetical protein
MIKHLVLAVSMASMLMVGFQATNVTAATKGEELERRQNQRTDDWAKKQKQKAREDAENKDGVGVGREKKVQDKERQIDKQAAQRKKDDAEARNDLPKDKMNEPYTKKKTDSKSQNKKR